MNAIETHGLTRRFKDITAVESLSLAVKEGELFSLLGVNGAGKTTTIRMLCGLLRPTEGDALVLGDSIISSLQKVKEKINISLQETAVARNLTVRENLEFIAGIYGKDKKSSKKKAVDMLVDFGLEDCAGRRANILSGGQQRRLSIAMALISEPKILFLDEPTLGLDVLARRELWESIKKLKGRITVILTTHYMEEAEALSDRVAVMEKGGLKAVGTPAELVSRTDARNFEEAFIALAANGRGIK